MKAIFKKEVGFGWFPIKEAECEPTKTKHSSVVFNQLYKLIPVGMVGNLASEYGVDKVYVHFQRVFSLAAWVGSCI
jgi:hypothetical protein